MEQTLFEYIKARENLYKTGFIEPIEGYRWNMYQHIRRSSLYKFSEMLDGKTDLTPIKNIILPIIRLQYRLQSRDVKDILLYLTNPEIFYKSMIVQKYHEKWALENKIDRFIDNTVESDVDFGGSLAKRTNEKSPEVVPLDALAFADMNNILSAPIGIRHEMSIMELKEMKEWGKKGADISVDELVLRAHECSDKNFNETGKIEIYEVRGYMQNEWYDKTEGYSNQLHIVSAIKKPSEKDKKFSTLFKSKTGKDLKFHTARERIHNRALAWGGIEELFEPQVWTNYSETRLRELIEEAAKVIYKTTDKKFGQKQSLKNSKTGQVYYLEGDIGQIDNFPRNAVLFERALSEWQRHAQGLGEAHNALRGENPTAGTPAQLQELVVSTGLGMHDYRKGKLDDYLAEVYNDWVIKDIENDLADEKEFFSELSLKEIQYIARNMAQSIINNRVIDSVLDRKGIMPKDEQGALMTMLQEDYKRRGNEKFIKILQDEFKGEKLGIKFNIANRQRDLAKNIGKTLDVFRTIFSMPQILENEGIADAFNQIIEYSGLSPIDLTSISKQAPQLPVETQLA